MLSGMDDLKLKSRCAEDELVRSFGTDGMCYDCGYEMG
jgi:hypothetical protein